MEVKEWLEANYTKEERHLLDVQKNAASPLVDYKGNYYAKINDLIRNGKEKIQSIYDIEGMKTCLCSFRICEDIMSFRYVDLKELLIILWKTNGGRSYIYPQFLSTTLLKDAFSMDYLKKGEDFNQLADTKGIFRRFTSRS